jgi:hypothetical protein
MPASRLAFVVTLAVFRTIALAPAAYADASLRDQVIETLAFAEQQLLASIEEVGAPSRFQRSTDSSTGLWTTRSSSD